MRKQPSTSWEPHSALGSVDPPPPGPSPTPLAKVARPCPPPVVPAPVSVERVCDLCFPHKPENFLRSGTVSVSYLGHWHLMCAQGVFTSCTAEPKG